MVFTLDDIDRLAKLARIELTPEEKETFRLQLSSIVDYVSKIEEVDVAGVRPTYPVPDLENVFREDAVTPDGAESRLVEAAPKRSDRLVRVKSVKEK